MRGRLKNLTLCISGYVVSLYISVYLLRRISCMYWTPIFTCHGIVRVIACPIRMWWSEIVVERCKKLRPSRYILEFNCYVFVLLEMGANAAAAFTMFCNGCCLCFA